MRGISLAEQRVGGCYGGCDVYAMTKCSRHPAAYWHSAALSMTDGNTLWGDRHAILLVHASQDDMVLDYLSPKLLRLKSPARCCGARFRAYLPTMRVISRRNWGTGNRS